jgi:hypothetical protein
MSVRASVLGFAVASGVLTLASPSSAAIIFDDFNTNIGHFGTSPQTSTTTNILKTTTPHSNAVARATVDPLEGTHNLDITIHGGGQSNASPSFPRIRLLSGGGTPANNTSFTTTAGTDGFIGYYYKVPAPGTLPGSLPAGLQLTINLDGPGGTSGVAAAGVAKNAIMDGQWHLVEWNLDNPADWGPFQGVGGDAVLDNATYTIDSIYFRYPVGTTWPGYTGIQTLGLDFVALNEAGSIAALVPEPSSLAVLGLGGVAMLARRRRD